MILYSIQEIGAWVRLKTHGRYYADMHKSLFLYNPDGMLNFENGLIAYRWMAEQFRKKKKHKIKSPVWVWQKYDGLTDLYKLSMHKYGLNQVMLKLDVPDDLVLLSDFDNWNCYLNYGYIDEDEQDIDEDEQDIDDFYSCCDMTKLEDYQKTVEDSWQRIFNVKDCENVQAIVPYLDYKWVQAVQIRRQNHKTKMIDLTGHKR